MTITDMWQMRTDVIVPITVEITVMKEDVVEVSNLPTWNGH